METTIEQRDRARGALLGLAVCDALGTTLEFGPRREESDFHTDITGGGPFGLEVGGWTDDTSMALCLGESLSDCGHGEGFHGDTMRRYVRWLSEGYLSHNGRCFDIGATTSGALRRFAQTGEPFSGSTRPMSAGNGSIMRLAPVPIYFWRSPLSAAELSGESSRTTHGARECVDACRYMGWMLASAIQSGDLRQSTFPLTSVLTDAVQTIALRPREVWSDIPRDRISSSGYVIHTLEAALWAFFTTSNFRDGAIQAVNLGDDADTVGAVYGQIAGAYYGESGIPEEWLDKVLWREYIGDLADDLTEAQVPKGAC